MHLIIFHKPAPLSKKLGAAQVKAAFSCMAFHNRLDSFGFTMRPSLSAPAKEAHKYDRGHAIIGSGPALRTGASRLSAQGALAVGAGLVTIIGDVEALHEQAAHVSAIMLREWSDPSEIMDRPIRNLAFAFGPGAGVNGKTAARTCAFLKHQRSIVLDADVLTSFENDPDCLFAHLHPKAVLTPHSGEFARLFPDINTEDPTSAALQAAQKCGAVVLLKGTNTAIAAPDGRTAVNRHSAPWLATAGSGDILTGIITGILAQGADAFSAACIGAWIHGDIGVRAGPGLTADEMASQIPLVLQGCLHDE
jgi:hydroxyethylthiazole kinase-like uncharacterized protein yjeF